MRYRKGLKRELLPKVVHVLLGVAIVLLVQANILSLEVLGLLTLLFGAILLYNANAEKEVLTRILSINKADAVVPGMDFLFYLTGCFLVLLLFDQKIAFAAILILAVGDAVADFVSLGFGGTQTVITKATFLEGTVAGIITSTLAAWLYVPLLPALVASTLALIVEAGEIHIGNHHVDDNIIIPLIAGIVLWAFNAIFAFGIFPF